MSNNIKNLQQQLYDLGYLTGPKAVDGIIGKNTRAAIAKAEADGYSIDNNKLSKKSTDPFSETREKVFSFVNKARANEEKVLPKVKAPYDYTDAQKKTHDVYAKQQELYNLGYLTGDFEKAVDGKWGKKSQAALDAAKKDGYFSDKPTKSSELLNKLQKLSDINVKDMSEEDALKTARSAGYVVNSKGDVVKGKVSTNNAWQYAPIVGQAGLAYHSAINKTSGNTIPYNYKHYEDLDKDLTKGEEFKSAMKKATEGLYGKNELDSAAAELADLDLSTEEGKKRAKELAPILNKYVFKNTKDPKSMQDQLRLRYDQLHIYRTGSWKDQKYGSFMPNPDYQAPRATKEGLITFTYSDPKLRKRQQENVKGFYENEKLYNELSKDAKGNYIPVHGDIKYSFNNYSVQKKQPDGSGSWLERYDLTGDEMDPFKNTVIIGDTIYSNTKPSATKISKGQPSMDAIETIKEYFKSFIK
jgi:peptidoglycan hydrolase-like protein with peptidoglycan-binding domain